MIFGKRSVLALLLGVALLAACARARNDVSGETYDQDVLKKATLMLVAWVAEGKPMPGYEPLFCPEQERAKIKEVQVICPYLPTSVALGPTPLVKRALEKYEGPPFSESGVLILELEMRKKLDDRLILVLKVLNLSQAGQKTFTFQNVDGKIRVRST